MAFKIVTILICLLSAAFSYAANDGVKVYLGGTWKVAPVKVYLGGTWKSPTVKIYLGGIWKTWAGGEVTPDHYVSNSGCSDSGQGTLAQPWCTVGKVNSSTSAGDVIAFAAGGVWTQDLEPVSGSVSNPTMYIVYGTGAKPKIKGFDAYSKQYASIDGFEIWNDNTSINNSPQPGTNSAAVFLGFSNHITLKNCYIYASSSNGGWAAIYGWGSDYNIIHANTIQHQNNSGLHDGLDLDQDCNYNVITNNLMNRATHYAFTLAGTQSSAPNFSNYNYIAYNTIENINGCAAQLYMNTFYNVVEYNTFYVQTSPVDQYPTVFKLLGERNIFRYNIIKGTGNITNARGLRSETYLYSSGWLPNTAQYNHVYNNVINGVYGTEGANGAIYVGTNNSSPDSWCRYNVYKNNIVFSNTGQYEITLQSGSLISGNQFRRNIIWRNSTQTVIWNTTGRTIAQQESASSDWTGNLYANPNLNNSYQPLVGSPAIGAGWELTQANGSGSGVVITVDDASYFHDGNGITVGDTVQIGGATRLVTDVNYSTNQITVNSTITWSDNQGVSLPYSGSAPNIGVY